MRTVSIVYPNVLDVGCISHSLDLVGGRFTTPVLSSFVSLRISVFSHIPKMKALWKVQTGRAMATFSKMRWWSRWEVMHQIVVQFSDVVPFLTTADGSAATRSHLLTILQNARQHQLLRVELASVIDGGQPFVKATYRLEGDGPLILQAYEEIATVRAAVQSAHYPSVIAVAKQIANGDAIMQQRLQTYASDYIRPGLQYFETKLGSELSPQVSAFKAARLFPPIIVHQIRPAATDVDII